MRLKISDNLPAILSRAHFGRAVLLLGGESFYIGQGWRGISNTIYVPPSGLPTNDGLTTDRPLDLTTGFNYLQTQVSANPSAIWKLKILAGAYPPDALKTSRAQTIQLCLRERYPAESQAPSSTAGPPVFFDALMQPLA